MICIKPMGNCMAHAALTRLQAFETRCFRIILWDFANALRSSPRLKLTLINEGTLRGLHMLCGVDAIVFSNNNITNVVPTNTIFGYIACTPYKWQQLHCGLDARVRSGGSAHRNRDTLVWDVKPLVASLSAPFFVCLDHRECLQSNT